MHIYKGIISLIHLPLGPTAGWQPVDLGPRTLRVETAAMVSLRQ